MDNNLRGILIRELNDLEVECEKRFTDKAPRTLALIHAQNQKAVDSSFEPNQTSRLLRAAIRTMKQALEKK